MRPLFRVVLGVLVGLVVAGALVGRLGLVGGDAIGAADNADGARLFCVAGLVPAADDGRASGHGIVVTEFRTGGSDCRIPPPVTSGGVVLGGAVALAPLLDRTPPAPDGSTRFSLEWLAGAYAVLFGLGAGVAAFAVASSRSSSGTCGALRVLAVVVVPLAPLLVVPWWSRFLVSTYAEPAGLLGTAWVVGGLLAVALTRPADRVARLTALGLVAAGGVVAATAKPGFLPVGLAAVAACALVMVGMRRWRRAPGLVAAVLAAALAAGPVLAGVRYQDTLYEVPNTHDLVFTAILPEAGPAALTPLGLPPEAFAHSGEHYYLDLGRGIPGWPETVGSRPVETRSAARSYLLAHPVVLARMVHRGLVATLRPQIRYLVSTTAGPRVVSGTLPVAEVPEGAQRMGITFAWLDALPGRRVPPAVAALALLGATATVVVPRLRRRDSSAVGLLRVAGVLAAGAVGMIALAVVGDGYVELTKHVWLASYLFVVAGLLLVGGTVLAAAGRFRR